ncbi:MAG TPA: peptidylprolyl isomerase [Candidatus Krumholzibacteria bacterium]|nr:peptidylprolyl isomerase [Candidatus Krumholzibacteria bacterium]
MRTRIVIPILFAVVAALFACEEDSTGPHHPAAPDTSRFFLIQTSMGDITLELYPDKAPVTVENFRRYAREYFYDGLIFHRVIQNFMNQGGGFTPTMSPRNPTHPPIQNEAGNGLSNVKYTIAMARTSVVNSATSQFFINAKDNLFLDHHDETPQGFGYAVFGKVVEGMAVVDSINVVPTGSVNGYNDVPKTTILIQSVRSFVPATP